VEVTTGQEFFTHLQKSRLLGAEPLAAAERRMAEAPEAPPSQLAQELVAQGLLTEWQAKQLLSGRHALFMGKYKLLDRLGGGGMGVVFTAHHAMTDRVVALKVMNRSIVSNPLAMSRFRAEVRLLCALSHPNIIAAYDADCAGSTHFLVMEHGRGKDLRVWLQEHEPLPVDWVCECIRQAALGLDHAHQRGLVHRDIKPENLLVEDPQPWRRPSVKILDLGLARLMGDESPEEAALRAPGQIMGTADYIAPEQVEQTDLADVRSDIFSLGCTLFKLLTGKLPFEGANYAEKLIARVAQDAPPASSLRKDAPAALDRVVSKMLRRDPNERYQSPAEVAEALYPFTIEGKNAQPTPPPLPPPVAPPAPAERNDQALGSFLNQLSSVEAPAAAARLAPKSNGAPGSPAASNLSAAANPPAVAQRETVAPKTLLAKKEPAAAAPPARRPARTRNARQSWLIGLGLGVAVSVPVVGLLLFVSRPATLALDWPLDERQGSELKVDGQRVAIPASNPAEISLTPGKHRIVVLRRRYEQLEWTLEFARGDRVERRLAWKRRDVGGAFTFGPSQ
jgi:serine/threonine protein kinase